MRTIAALCVSGRSIYKHLPGVVAFDRARDARTFGGGVPVVAHPPCRCWSKYLSHQAKPPDRAAEMNLGRWCVEQVLTHGGVMEHPAHSKLFADCNMPLPNSPEREPFLYSIYVEQGWFGYVSRKPTWVLVAGVPRHQLPAVPFSLGERSSLTGLSQAARSRTLGTFADFLCQIARLTWWSLPQKTGCQDIGHLHQSVSNRILERPFVPKAAPRAKSLALPIHRPRLEMESAE